jgi:phosphoglycerate dehydrogenase-like enzyme
MCAVSAASQSHAENTSKLQIRREWRKAVVDELHDATVPLWDEPNLLVAPHAGSETAHYTDRAVGIVADNLRRFSGGEPLRNVLDKHLHY